MTITETVHIIIDIHLFNFVDIGVIFNCLLRCMTGIEQEGSNLSGVSGCVCWEEVHGQDYSRVSNPRHPHTDHDSPQLSATGLLSIDISGCIHADLMAS